MPKTREEVNELMRQWKNDPCWDIYDTEGFEEYHDELKVFQDAYELNKQLEHQQELERVAVRLGVPGNLLLAMEWERMENKIDVLAYRLRKIELD